jgi:hypothetical protein
LKTNFGLELFCFGPLCYQFSANNNNNNIKNNNNNNNNNNSVQLNSCLIEVLRNDAKENIKFLYINWLKNYQNFLKNVLEEVF